MTLSAKKVYPRGLLLGAIVNACNMAGLATLNALLVLYCTHQLNIPVKHAYAIYAAFGSLFYGASLLGGFLGGKYDYKVAITLGMLLSGSGSFFLAIDGAPMMFLGLAFFIVGCGLIIPNLYCIVGKLYAKDGQGRDSGFTVVYALSNLGGMIAAFSSGFIAVKFGYHVAFFIIACALLFSLLLFLVGYKRFDFYQDKKTPKYRAETNLKNIITMSLILIIAVPIITLLLNHAEISNILLLILGVIMLAVLIVLAIKEKGAARTKLLIFIFFVVLSLVFWALYMLAPSALVIFIQHNVNRHIGHFVIPAGSFYGLNPFFIIIFGPLVSLFLLWLTKKKIHFSLPGKFSLGITCMGIGYLTLFVGIYFASRDGFVAMGWIILSYFLQSFGELFIGPTSLAMVGKLCPIHLEGLMMGACRLSIGVAGALSGFLAAATTSASTHKHMIYPVLTNPQFKHAFGWYGVVTVIIGIFVLLFIPIFKKFSKVK